jgi:hypothetical protein
VVDRRFNQRRYDAARAIETFRARLRQQVDLDTLTAELLNLVDQTMEPVQVSPWLRPSSRSQDQSKTTASRAPPANLSLPNQSHTFVKQAESTGQVPTVCAVTAFRRSGAP